MTSERQERKLQATIDHIGAVAWRMFEADGFDSVSMESIAVAADVAKGTLYKHFPVKEALIGHRFESDRRAHARKIDVAVMAKTSCAERLTLRLKKEAEYIEKMRR
jgi:AcrR family transcriptional regulator